MIRHIVLWKLGAEDAAGKAASVEAIAGVLEPLVHLDGVESLTVRANDAYFEANWDVVLFSEFKSLAALDAYQVHPEHVAAGAVVRAHVTQRASVDYEL